MVFKNKFDVFMCVKSINAYKQGGHLRDMVSVICLEGPQSESSAVVHVVNGFYFSRELLRQNQRRLAFKVKVRICGF